MADDFEVSEGDFGGAFDDVISNRDDNDDDEEESSGGSSGSTSSAGRQDERPRIEDDSDSSDSGGSSGGSSSSSGGTSDPLSGGSDADLPDAPSVDRDNPFDDSDSGSSGGSSDDDDSDVPVGNTPDSGNLPSSDGGSSGSDDPVDATDPTKSTDSGLNTDNEGTPAGFQEPPEAVQTDSSGRNPENIESGPASQEQDPQQGVEEGGQFQEEARQAEFEFIQQAAGQGVNLTREEVRVSQTETDDGVALRVALNEAGQQEVEFENFQREFQAEQEAENELQNQTRADLVRGDDFEIEEISNGSRVRLTTQGREKETRAQTASALNEELDLQDEQRIEPGDVETTRRTDVSSSRLPGNNRAESVAVTNTTELVEEQLGERIDARDTDVSPDLGRVQQAVQASETSDTDRFEAVVDRAENLSGRDVPGEGDILPGRFDVSRGVENYTGVDLPEPNEIGRRERILLRRGVDAFTQSQIGQAVSGGVDTATDQTIPFTNISYENLPRRSVNDAQAAGQQAQRTNVPFTNTQFREVPGAAQTGAQEATEVSVPFTDTQFREVPGEAAEGAQEAAETNVPFTSTRFNQLPARAEQAGNVTVPFTDIPFADVGSEAAEGGTEATNTALNQTIPFTDTQFRNAPGLVAAAADEVNQAVPDSPEGTNPLLFSGSVAFRQAISDESQSEARATVTERAEAAEESTVDSFSPAVGRNPASGINAVRGIAGITALAGAFGVAREVEVPDDSEQDDSEISAPEQQDSQEIEAPEPRQQSEGELPANRGVRVPELTTPTPRSSSDPTTVRTQLVTGVVEQQEPEQQEPQDRREITEDTGPELGEPDQPPPSSRERQRREDLDPFERTFPTGGSSVADGTGNQVDDVQGRNEQAQERQANQPTESEVQSPQPRTGIFGRTDVGQGPQSDTTPDVGQDTFQAQGNALSQLLSPQQANAQAQGNAEANANAAVNANVNVDALGPATATQQASRSRPRRPRLPDIGGADDDEEELFGPAGSTRSIITNFRDPISGDVLETEDSDNDGPDFGGFL